MICIEGRALTGDFGIEVAPRFSRARIRQEIKSSAFTEHHARSVAREMDWTPLWLFGQLSRQLQLTD